MIGSSTSSPPAAPAAKLPLLDSEVLRSFVTIAESGSFTRAARQLFRTPSALSMQIKRLEETLGQTLFVREARHVALTTEGEVLLGYGRRLLRLNAEAVNQFLSPGLEGRVRFGLTDDVLERALSRVLPRFAREFPAVQVDVSVARSVELVERLDAGELDLVLVTVGNPGTEARGEIVHRETLVWAGREGGLAAQRSPLPVALAQQGCPWRTMALNSLDRAGIAYRVAYSCDLCAGQQSAVAADLAVVPFPSSLVRAPLVRIGGRELPPLGEYQVALMRRANGGEIDDVLARQVAAAFEDG